MLLTYVPFGCYLDFEKLENILEIFFLAVTRLILEKKKSYISHFLHNFSKKQDITSDAIILIATKVSCQKHLPIRIYARGGALCAPSSPPPPPPPQARSDKNTSWKIGFN